MFRHGIIQNLKIADTIRFDIFNVELIRLIMHFLKLKLKKTI